MAAENGHFDVVRVLLTAHANVNQADTYGCTPLWMAAQNGHVDVVRVLINAHANVNQARTEFRVTPLHKAAYKGHVDIIKLLMKAGADHLATDSSGNTPLQIAQEFDKADAAATLRSAETTP